MDPSRWALGMSRLGVAAKRNANRRKPDDGHDNWLTKAALRPGLNIANTIIVRRGNIGRVIQFKTSAECAN
jgi:hypothetical protein